MRHSRRRGPWLRLTGVSLAPCLRTLDPRTMPCLRSYSSCGPWGHQDWRFGDVVLARSGCGKGGGIEGNHLLSCMFTGFVVVEGAWGG